MDFEELLERANQRLKAGGFKATIRKRKQSLTIRATFPPKKGEISPKQRDLALGFSVNPEALKLAEIKAKGIALSLQAGTFDWKDYIDPQLLQLQQTVGFWVNEFEINYFESRERTPTKLSTYHDEYEAVFNRLDDGEMLTASYLKKMLLAHTKADTRQRQRWAIALTKLANLSGLDVNFRPLIGNYSPQKIRFKDLPTDDEIFEWYGKVDPEWRWAYGAIALWGIRPHELWHLDTRRLSPSVGVLDVESKTKTGSRSVYPSRWDWYLAFKLWHVELDYVLKLKGKNNKALGHNVSKAWARMGVP